VVAVLTMQMRAAHQGLQVELQFAVVAVVVVDVVRTGLAFVGVGEWMVQGLQGLRIRAVVVAVELVSVDEVWDRFVCTGTGWSPSGAAVMSPGWA